MNGTVIVLFSLLVLACLGCYGFVIWSMLSEMRAGECCGCSLYLKCRKSVLLGKGKLCDTMTRL